MEDIEIVRFIDPETGRIASIPVGATDIEAEFRAAGFIPEAEHLAAQQPAEGEGAPAKPRKDKA